MIRAVAGAVLIVVVLAAAFTVGVIKALSSQEWPSW